MKAHLIFNLPEEREEFYRANKSTDLCSVIFQFQEYLRFKHCDKEPSGDMIRTRFYEILDDHGIKIDELYS